MTHHADSAPQWSLMSLSFTEHWYYWCSLNVLNIPLSLCVVNLLRWSIGCRSLLPLQKVEICQNVYEVVLGINLCHIGQKLTCIIYANKLNAQFKIMNGMQLYLHPWRLLTLFNKHKAKNVRRIVAILFADF